MNEFTILDHNNFDDESDRIGIFNERHARVIDDEDDRVWIKIES